MSLEPNPRTRSGKKEPSSTPAILPPVSPSSGSRLRSLPAMRYKRPASHSRSNPSDDDDDEGGSSTNDDPNPSTPSKSVTDSPGHKRPKRSPGADADAVEASFDAPVAATTSRRSERRRRPREFAVVSAHERGSAKKVWTPGDVVALLKAAVAFRDRTGSLPRKATMDAFFRSLKGSISSYLSLEQVGYKLKRLKSKYIHQVAAGLYSNATGHDRIVNDLSAEIWASEARQTDGDAEDEDMEVDETNQIEDESESEEEAEDGGAKGDRFPFIREAAVYWKGNGNCLSGLFLEQGLKLIDPSKGKVLEGKLRKQCEAETRLLVKRLDLLKEISELLMEAHRSSRL